MADRVRRGRWLVALTVVLCATLLAAAVWTDVQARTRSRSEAASLSAADAHLASLRHGVSVTRYASAVTGAKRDALRASILSTLNQLATTNAALDSANAYAYLQGTNIGTLQTCLGGVQNALNQIAVNNNDQAAKDISAVSAPCTQLAGGPKTGLVYPFDFPDPNVILVGQTYFAYATNSVAGNIQIIQSSDLTHWTVVGNALPSLPTWAAANNTWAPSVAASGGGYLMYYAVDVAGTGRECISVATASQPQGPFVDSSTVPLECQKSLGGSIDPISFTDVNGTPYLVWKSGGPGTSTIWSEQLDPTATVMAAGSMPTKLLVPDQSWENGTVEAPDMVYSGGHYLLFFSGNDWNSANYAVGIASCAGPLGPCNDASPKPILASGPGVAGPGGESVFTDAGGTSWIAFHAWVPGAVRFPNSRDLYLRRLTLTGPVPVVAAPG